MSIQEQLVNVLERVSTTLDRQHAAFQAAAAETANANRLRAARACPAPGDGGRPLLWAGPARLVGWSLHAVGGDVVVTVTDSRDGTGDSVASIALIQGQSQAAWFGPGGISAGEGLFADVSGAGTLAGAFWLGAVD